MEVTVRKRLRSDDCSPCAIIQSKVFVNQRKINENDASKMRQIQEKTVRNLFEGSRKVFLNKKFAVQETKKLNEQVTLHGDGRIEFLKSCMPKDIIFERRKANCCVGLNTCIQDRCNLCNFSLCEQCGYSCTDCANFACRSCVSLSGFGYPICGACAIFN